MKKVPKKEIIRQQAKEAEAMKEVAEKQKETYDKQIRETEEQTGKPVFRTNHIFDKTPHHLPMRAVSSNPEDLIWFVNYDEYDGIIAIEYFPRRSIKHISYEPSQGKLAITLDRVFGDMGPREFIVKKGETPDKDEKQFFSIARFENMVLTVTNPKTISNLMRQFLPSGHHILNGEYEGVLHTYDLKQYMDKVIAQKQAEEAARKQAEENAIVETKTNEGLVSSPLIIDPNTV